MAKHADAFANIHPANRACTGQIGRQICRTIDDHHRRVDRRDRRGLADVCAYAKGMHDRRWRFKPTNRKVSFGWKCRLSLDVHIRCIGMSKYGDALARVQPTNNACAGQIAKQVRRMTDYHGRNWPADLCTKEIG